MSDDFFLTLGAVSRGSGLCDSTIRAYVRLGLLDCRLDSTGRRLFAPEAPAEARHIFEGRQRRLSTGVPGGTPSAATALAVSHIAPADVAQAKLLRDSGSDVA